MEYNKLSTVYKILFSCNLISTCLLLVYMINIRIASLPGMILLFFSIVGIIITSILISTIKYNKNINYNWNYYESVFYRDVILTVIISILSFILFL